MLNIFLIQPMRGKKVKQILRARANVLKSLVSKDEFQIINNVYEEPLEEVKYDSIWYLGKSLESLSKADIVLLYPGWENYDGCVVEYQCAVKNKLPIKALMTEKEREQRKEIIYIKKPNVFKRIIRAIRGV